jgi:hypothetical protein
MKGGNATPIRMGRLPIMLLIRPSPRRRCPTKAGFLEAKGINVGHQE